MRATNHKHYGSDNAVKKTVKAGFARRKGVKIASAVFSFLIAAAALIVPTTTLAPDVNAYEDSRVASYSVGDIDAFSSVIKENCVEVTTSPATEEPTTVEQTTEEETTEPVTEAEVEETTAPEEPTEATEEPETVAEVKEEPAESSEAEETSSDEEQSQTSEDESDSYTEENSETYQGSALIEIDNPDSSYTPAHISLTSYDRDVLERLVYGEAGGMGFNGCALVAQTIRDSMARLGTTSIDRIISECGYYGSTSSGTSQTAKDAVSFIFDQDGNAVQHRVLVFYNPSMCSSPWHESQLYITSVDGERFFDMI